MRGRKPTPGNIVRLLGNPGKRRIKDGLQAPPAKPEPPEHLTPGARAEWTRITAALSTLGILSGLDMAAVAGYCSSYARWIEAEQKLQTEGLVFKSPKATLTRPNVYVQIANAALQMMLRFATELGLTPAARMRISAPGDRAIRAIRLLAISSTIDQMACSNQRPRRPRDRGELARRMRDGTF
jgi:P27 family predicted phage terminase small subunit